MAADADAPDGEMSDTETTQQSSAGTDSTPATGLAAGHEDAAEPVAPAVAGEGEDAVPTERRLSPVLLATVVGLIAVLALAGVGGWSGLRAYRAHQDQQQRELFLRVGRQGAVNLTTIDWEHVDNDIQRILDSATGPFYDDFTKRSQPFIDVVKRVRSKSVGTIAEAGLESVSGDEARVLVAVSVKTSNLGEADQPPRAWRMRIDVQKVDGGAKVSNVLFVPA